MKWVEKLSDLVIQGGKGQGWFLTPRSSILESVLLTTSLDWPLIGQNIPFWMNELIKT